MPRGAPGDPAERPVGPSDALQMATLYKKKVIIHFAKLMANWYQNYVKQKNQKLKGVSPSYLICFYNGCNDKLLALPGQKLITRDIHYNYNELKCMINYNLMMRLGQEPKYITG